MQNLESFVIETVPRACDLCAGTNLIEASSYRTSHNTRALHTLWSVRNVVCRDCGFAFVSPVPTEDCLTRYYEDNHALYYNETHRVFDEIYHDEHKRLAVIERHAPRTSARKRFVEIGGNATNLLMHLNRWFDETINIEINASVDGRRSSWDDVEPASASVVASYYVLEHIPTPKAFLERCRRVVAADGIVLVEVPDADFYPVDYTALNFHEHVNHFTPETLIAMAAQVGLDVIEISHQDRSMSFGFVAVFRPSESINVAPFKNPNAFLRSLSSLKGGTEAIVNRRAAILAEAQRLRKIRDENGPLVLWGANRLCLELFDTGELESSIHVVDSNPDKKFFLEKVEVNTPGEALEVLAIAPTIYFCAPIRDIVVEQVRRSYGIDISDRTLIVTNYSI